jgi:two-component system, cell cycle response regulator
VADKPLAKRAFPLTQPKDFASFNCYFREIRMNQPTILVVEDELFFRHLYTELLSEDGYRVEAVETGEQALQHLRSGGVDIVLADLILPGISGLEVLRFCRNLNLPPEVILVTGHASTESAIQALKHGARDYLIKPFNPEELRHLVRVCLEQRRLLDENSLLQSQIRLYQKGQNLASQLEIEQLLPQAINVLLQELGGGRGFAYLAEQSSSYQLFGLTNLDEIAARATIQIIQDNVSQSSTMNLLQQQNLPNLPFASAHQVYLLPLLCQKQLKGAIVLINPEDSLFSSIPKENLLFLSEQTGLGFENAYRFQGARELIYTDDLTGLYNHRYLKLTLDQEILRAERYDLQFSVVFIDLDHFKGINDTYGHLAGSKALREVAMLLRKSVREVDLLFRYGGDEFTALLVETDKNGAAVVSERFRRTIERHTFLAEDGLCAHLTATIGYATFPESAVDQKGVIDLADKAMYEGKTVRNVVRGAWELK